MNKNDWKKSFKNRTFSFSPAGKVGAAAGSSKNCVVAAVTHPDGATHKHMCNSKPLKLSHVHKHTQVHFQEHKQGDY